MVDLLGKGKNARNAREQRKHELIKEGNLIARAEHENANKLSAESRKKLPEMHRRFSDATERRLVRKRKVKAQKLFISRRAKNWMRRRR